MVVINPDTGLRYNGQDPHGESLLFKTADDYYSYIMQNFSGDYYGSKVFRDDVNKIIKVLSE